MVTGHIGPGEPHGAFAPAAECRHVTVQLNPFRLPVRAGNHEPRGSHHVRFRLRMRQARTTAASAAMVYDSDAGTWPEAAVAM